jgi:serine/threonine-protein kinase
MEYIDGITLKEFIEQQGVLKWKDALHFVTQILRALQHAHDKGIVHRDIKPQNILVHEDGHIKVADFGIARIADSATLTRGDNVMGSVHYFSPEQARGEGATAASDIYSTGVVLYEMLTGRVPYDGDNPVAVAMQHLHAAPVPIQNYSPDVPPAVIRVCMKAMEKNPAMRYLSALDMAADLRAALEERGEQVPYPENELVVRQPKPQVSGGDRTANTGPRKKIRMPSKRSLRILLDILLALAVMAGLFFGGKAIYEQTIFTVKVPNVMGLNIDEAARILKQAGLTETHKAMPNDQVERNQVYVQNPGAETTARKGDAVILVISSGPVPFEMPDVVGKTADEATSLLIAKNMKITRDRAASTDVPKGSVMSQVPAAGEQVTRDDPVTLTISGGSTVVPSLLNCTLEEAEEMLTKQNLTLQPSLKFVITDNESEHGRVAASSPEAENRVAEDTPVQLTLYRFPDAECTASLSVLVPLSDQQLKVRISIHAEQSNVAIDTRTYTVEPEDPRLIEQTVDIPDNRSYTYAVYIGDTQLEQKSLNPKAASGEETGNE